MNAPFPPTKLARMIRSGLRRYPRHLASSLRRNNAQLHTPTPAASLCPAPNTLGAIWLGHSSTLLHIGGRWILTDPVFSDRIGVRVGRRTIGIGRDLPLPLCPTKLPPIDFILISHAHFDHLDRPTLRRLACPRTTVITAERTGRLIPAGFNDVIELPCGQQLNYDGVSIQTLQPTHWGARMVLDRRRGVNAYLLEHNADRILYAGDTAVTHAFNALESIRLAIFGIGAYDPWEHAHATPEQVWSMFCALGADHLLPVHHSTFELSDEHPDEPMRRLLRAARADNERIIRAHPGELWTPFKAAG